MSTEKADGADPKPFERTAENDLQGGQKDVKLSENWQSFREKAESKISEQDTGLAAPEGFDASPRLQPHQRMEQASERAETAEIKRDAWLEGQADNASRPEKPIEDWENSAQKPEQSEAEFKAGRVSDPLNEPDIVDEGNAEGVYTVPVGTTAEELNLLIAEAPPGSIIVLQDGTHEFDATITIDRDDITITGESEEGTVLNFTFPEGIGENAIEVTGGEKNKVTTLSAGVDEGATIITVADASSLSAGDVIYISQPNTEEYLLENGWDNVSFDDADDRPFREVLVRVESVDGDQVTLCDPLPYAFDPDATTVSTTDLLEDVTLADFTVTSGLEGEPNYYDFVNNEPEFEDTAVIRVDGADGIDLSGISVLDAPSNAFEFHSTIDLTADDLYVNGAHNLGGGGNGYGIELSETFGADITDVDLQCSPLGGIFFVERGNRQHNRYYSDQPRHQFSRLAR